MSLLGGHEYIKHITERCKWGISLQGRGSDKKCMRETEFAIWGVPIALNFDPYFPFEFKEGEHFFRLRTPEDIFRLEEIDEKPFAEASRRLGELYFSPSGCLNIIKYYLEQSEYNPRMY